jgi:hypothetical protein
MSWVQALEVGAGLGVGLGLGLLLARRLWAGRAAKEAPARAAGPAPASLERAKQEAKLLSLEKENLAAIITGFYEAEARGEITPEERKLLVAKYEAQFQSVSNRLAELGLYIEVGELEKLREEIVALLKGRLEQIEARLRELRSRLPSPAPAAEPKPPPIEEKPKPARERPQEELSVEGRVRKIREEVLKALERLEQVEEAG